MDTKVKLSLFWVFAVLNYLYCDIMGLMDTALLKQYLSGTIGTVHITQSFLFSAAVLMEIPISMVLLSRLVNYKTNRWLNIIAGSIMSMVQISTLFVGKPTLYYLFFSIIEIACTLVIVVTAWKWMEIKENLN